MIKTSGIRDKLRSGALKELARERGLKRGLASGEKLANKDDKSSDSEDDRGVEEITRLEQERRLKRAKQSNNSLLSVLPEPKNSSAFGPTVRLDKLLKMPERTEEHLTDAGRRSESPTNRRMTEDGMLEVNISKVVGDDAPGHTLAGGLAATPGDSYAPSVVLPKGKEKQKNQITYLAQAAKVYELKHKEEAAQGRANRAAARSKYGW